jgi:hypothetical protein
MRLPQGSRTKISKKLPPKSLNFGGFFRFYLSVFRFLDFSPRKQVIISFVPRLTRNEASNLSYSVFT